MVLQKKAFDVTGHTPISKNADMLPPVRLRVRRTVEYKTPKAIHFFYFLSLSIQSFLFGEV